MGASTAQLGHGSALYVNTSVTAAPGDNELADWQGVGGTWTLLFTMPKSLELPTAETEDVQVSSLLSPGKRHEYIPGWVETGSISGEANITMPEYEAALAKVAVKYGYRISTVASGEADNDTPDFDSHTYFLGHLSLGNPTLTGDAARSTSFSIKVDSNPVVDSNP